MKKSISTKISLNSIINFLICIVMVSYAGPFASYRGSLVLIFALGILILLQFTFSRKSINKKNFIIWQILFMYLLLNSSFNFPSSLLYLLLYVVGYMLIKKRMGNKDFIFIFKFLKYISIILAISILVQVFMPEAFYRFAKNWFYYSNQYDQVVYLGTYVKQYSGIFYEVSFSAIILAIGILIQYVEMIYEEKNIIKKIIFVSILYFSIILTGKRSFILIVPFLMLVLYFIYNATRIKISTFLISIIIILVILWKFDDILTLIINILGKNTTNGIELSSREKFWNLGFNMFKSNPIIGQGINSYDIFFNNSGIRNIKYEFAGAHNSYIQLLAEIGIIGFLLYIGGILISLKNAFYYLISKNNSATINDKKNIAISISVLLLLLCYGFTGNVLYQPQQLITFFLFISIIENTINNERNY